MRSLVSGLKLFVVLMVIISIGISVGICAEGGRDSLSSLEQAHISNLQKLPDDIRKVVVRDHPKQKLVSLCEGKLTGRPVNDFALALFEPSGTTLTLHVYGIKKNKPISFQAIARGKSRFDNPIKMVTQYSAVQCFDPEKANDLSGAVHAGSIGSDGKLDTVCFALDDTGADCYRFDTAKQKFIEAEGWAN